MTRSLISVQNFCVDYLSSQGPIRAVDDVSFNVGHNEVLGLAGESGSGKSTIVKALLRILEPPGVISGGRVLFEGRDLLGMGEAELRRYRWKKIALVFQSAMNALNPVMTIGEQLVDVMLAHERMTTADAWQRAARALDEVGIDPRRIKAYPHELSGGMRQRVVIAIALALRPPLLIMDEPTTALDVVVQKEILQQIHELRRQHEFSILFITHDIGLMLEMCDRIGVLYAGKLVELAPSEKLHSDAEHPYTEGLMNSCPSIHNRQVELRGIPGSPPDMRVRMSGCCFHPRCERAGNEPRCRTQTPPTRVVADQHTCACHIPQTSH